MSKPPSASCTGQLLLIIILILCAVLKPSRPDFPRCHATSTVVEPRPYTALRRRKVTEQQEAWKRGEFEYVRKSVFCHFSKHFENCHRFGECENRRLSEWENDRVEKLKNLRLTGMKFVRISYNSIDLYL